MVLTQEKIESYELIMSKDEKERYKILYEKRDKRKLWSINEEEEEEEIEYIKLSFKRNKLLIQLRKDGIIV